MRSLPHHSRRVRGALAALLTAGLLAQPACAEDPDGEAGRTLGSDIKGYFTSPLRWDRYDWAWFAGSLVAIGAAHHYDTQVRTHFLKLNGMPQSSKELPDFYPTFAVLGATWLYAGLVDSSAGHEEVWNMVEAAGLSSVTAYVVKFATNREGPDQTGDPNRWGHGGHSFPSEHSAASFAVGTVLAESGSDEFRWVRRLLGYGLGAGTSYLRLKHDAHWLSDTVAGAALGIAGARFVLKRSDPENEAHLGIEPVPGGAMLTYTRQGL